MKLIAGGTKSLVVLALIGASLAGCMKQKDSDELMTMDDDAIRTDKQRYAHMNFFTMSYLGYDVYGTYVMPATKNSLEHAVAAPSIAPSQTEDHWGGGNTGNTFYWDRTWSTPKQFRVWWFRVVDPLLFKKNSQHDEYTSKETRPGAAWCEAIVTIDKPPPDEPRYFILHFYPDGHVEGYLSALKEFDAEKMRFTIADRDKLPVLQGKPCLKEIPNPFYGLKKPIAMY